MDTFDSPTAIGGLGGSGTRVFAAMLRHAGIHIGDTLNEPLDNLWFAVLFKRRAWTGTRPPPEAVAQAAALFVRAMTCGLADGLDPAERALIARLGADLPPDGGWKCGPHTCHAQALADSLPPPAGPRPWGWKEPNTHVFLPALDRQIPGLRYIHVLRDGLDMAFSANTWQARHWEHLYPLPPGAGTPMPLRQLRFWTAANRAALLYGTQHMPGRFLVVRYEAFCADPAAQWPRIRRFLGAPEGLELPADLLRPTSIGRSSDRPLSGFPGADLTAARALQSDMDKAAALE
ncbi:sulfotransferase [Puniceibacterium confluentis]|uniref:sulfotransferase n=1 Tax=Puniceibacterium confluentis TaxID=1958944 RepID=UPI0011B654F8|nr:sulfotransferase [Puniceibacterium confluentis]